MTYFNKLRLFLLTIILSGHLLRWHSCEVFTSVAQMEYLVDYQFEVSMLLRNHILYAQIYMDGLRENLDDLKDLGTVVRTVFENRKNCSRDSIYSFIKLFTLIRTWRKLAYYIERLTRHRKQLLNYLSTTRARIPTREDLDGAAMAILRLQETYNLNAESFLHITSQDTGLHPIMHLDDLFYMGRTAFLNNKMALTSQWMKSALRSSTVNNSEAYILGKSSIDINYEIDIRDHLAYAEYRIGKYETALNYTREILSHDPKNENALANINIIQEKLTDSYIIKQVKYKIPEDEFYLQDTYEELCRGESKRTSNNKRASQSKLVCGYKSKDPRLRIRPIKYELISVAPEIYLFHQMATNYELKVLKRLAFPQLQRATVSDIETKKLQTAPYRISQSGWLSDGDHKTVARISQRMEAVTGLSSKTAEDLQVANYGIGGHYEPHLDWSRHFENSEMQKFGQGNRIATCLLYLNDIAAGGATVFMDPELAIWPQKGSMAFWYNLYRNGTGKENTAHAACPVLLGSKWVANKWFHERGQEYTRPCGLKRTQ